MCAIKEKLSKEFESQLETLSITNPGSDEYKAIVDGTTKLADRIIEIEKNEKDAQNNKHRNMIEVGKFVGGIAVFGIAFAVSMNFEKTGRLTTDGGKEALRKLFGVMKL